MRKHTPGCIADDTEGAIPEVRRTRNKVSTNVHQTLRGQKLLKFAVLAARVVSISCCYVGDLHSVVAGAVIAQCGARIDDLRWRGGVPTLTKSRERSEKGADRGGHPHRFSRTLHCGTVGSPAARGSGQMKKMPVSKGESSPPARICPTMTPPGLNLKKGIGSIIRWKSAPCK